jgi:hypothetical protein
VLVSESQQLAMTLHCAAACCTSLLLEPVDAWPTVSDATHLLVLLTCACIPPTQLSGP